MVRAILLCSLAVLAACSSAVPQPEGERGDGPNIVLITIDGLRWQEVFRGADPDLMANESYVENAGQLRETFWHDEIEQRRRLLMPFLWQVIGSEGQLYGNRAYGCEARVSNGMWFSYPGYSELLVGYPDDERITSNDPIDNPNVTVLETIHALPQFRGRVAGAAMWDPIGNAVNETRSGIPMRTSVESLGSYPGAALPAFVAEAGGIFSSTPWHHTRDSFLDHVTFNNTLDLVEEMKPRVLYMALGTPDEDAHHGYYEGYLQSIRRTDEYIRRLWETLEAMPEYAGRTSYLITVDHGRGLGEQWTDHGTETPHSDEVWFALLGPQVQAKGEVRESCQLTSAQVASTLAALLGLPYRNEKPVAERLPY